MKKKQPNKQQPAPKLKNMILLGNFTDGKVRQLIFNEDVQRITFDILALASPDKVAQALETPVEGITWESEIDLSK